MHQKDDKKNYNMTRGEQGPTRPNLKGLGWVRWMLGLGLGQKLE